MTPQEIAIAGMHRLQDPIQALLDELDFLEERAKMLRCAREGDAIPRLNQFYQALQDEEQAEEIKKYILELKFKYG